MRVCFVEPPIDRQGGGLGIAIRSLCHALSKENVSVMGETALEESGHIDVVHFHALWEPRHWWLSRRCRTLGVPYVVSPHGMLEPWAWRDKQWKKLPYFHLFERARLAAARALLATSETEARNLRALLPTARVVAIPLGLSGDARAGYAEARQKLGWGADERILVFLSRIHRKKGLDLLVQALEGRTEGRLVIVGSGEASYVASLRDLCLNRVGRLPRIEWVGEVLGEARWPYLQGADLFCLPSHSENFGLAVLEACQVGTPVLTSTQTPWGEALTGRPGFICQPTVESIRVALDQFWSKPLASPEERAALADWAWATFSWKTLAPRYVEFYATLANS